MSERAPIVENISEEFAASPEELWSFRINQTNLPKVNDDVLKVDQIRGEAGELGAGTAYICDIAFSGGFMVSKIDVVEAEKPRSFTLDMESWPVTARGERPNLQPGTGAHAREVVKVSGVGSEGSRVEIEMTAWPPDEADEAMRTAFRDASVAMIKKELEGMRPFLDRPTGQ